MQTKKIFKSATTYLFGIAGGVISYFYQKANISYAKGFNDGIQALAGTHGSQAACSLSGYAQLCQAIPNFNIGTFIIFIVIGLIIGGLISWTRK